jgi:cyclopropane-fatty-acyl-phospholipid synthase
MAVPATAADPAVRASQQFLERLTAGYRPRDFAVRFWDGTIRDPEPGQPALFTLALRHPGALRAMFWPPNGVAFGEAYVNQDFDIGGDIFPFLRLTTYLNNLRPGVLGRLALGLKLFALPSPRGLTRADRHPAARLSGTTHSVERDRQAISYHYDVGNDFYRLWLDRELVYTCAYFKTPGDDIHAAQDQKNDHVCRKLRLKPGERFLDMGCGWGGLVRHAVRHYGVTALGVTLSKRQAELAQERIVTEGLADRARVEYRDYREVADTAGFDKIACIGMLEHVGEAGMPTYFAAAWWLLKPGGVFLSHHITRRGDAPPPKWARFVRQYVFPDGELKPVSTALRYAEQAGFEVRDVESLREHYALTLEHWVRALEAQHAEAVKATSEATYRVFRLYLAGARHSFLNGNYNLHQSLLVKPTDDGKAGLPLTRAGWYS